MERKYLLTPGPTPLPDEVRRALGLPIIHHRTSEFQQIFTEVNQDLKYLFQTKGDIFTFSASGTGAMESAVVNLLSPGDKAIVVCGGKFGERWRDICQAYAVEVISIDVEWGSPVAPEEIKQILKADQQIKAVFTTLCETSTGVVNDIQAIGQIVADSSAVLVVDAISALGAEDLQTDNWQIDCVVVGSQKGMMLPPGLAFCSVSNKAWELVKSSKLPKFYFDFKKAKKTYDKNDTPFTPAVSLIVALREALLLIKKQGLAEVFKQHQLKAHAARAALEALGFKIFSKTSCNVLTAAFTPEGVDSTELTKLMRTKFGVSVANGQGEFKGKIIRLAHLGHIQAADLIKGISVLEQALAELGQKIEKGKGVQAAEKVLAITK
ncbi:MAG: alanine--glyoxylate aminotransferase family protein [Candidatus Omnitrophica bacterium]|nr:alanine--glyoxylate aminotransferase family protein [Candidatus Omnitrophota bacterium]